MYPSLQSLKLFYIHNCLGIAVETFASTNFKLRFHLYVYVSVSVSYQDRLEDMKCFHSYVFVCGSSIWIATDSDSDGGRIHHLVCGIV